MEQSTHFKLNLVTGSDKVNPLTVDRPNYEIIDSQMYKNQAAGISEATELKSSTVHAITCLTEGAVFFRFTATSDYNAGDTFTYNGTPVSAVFPDGTGLTAGVFKVNSTVLCSIIGTLLTVYSVVVNSKAADSEKLGGQLPSYYARAADSISTYIHSRIGTVNNFVGTGDNGKVRFAANILPGDTVQINGQSYTAYAGVVNFVEAMANVDITGKTAFMAIDATSNTVTFTIARDVQEFTPAGYSTSPVDTGKKWIDGKTVWRKVITFTTPAVGAYNYVQIGDTVDSYVSAQAFFKYSREAGVFHPSGGASMVSGVATLQVFLDSFRNNESTANKNTVVVHVARAGYDNQEAYLIVEYTRV